MPFDLHAGFPFSPMFPMLLTSLTIVWVPGGSSGKLKTRKGIMVVGPKPHGRVPPIWHRHGTTVWHERAAVAPAFSRKAAGVDLSLFFLLGEFFCKIL